MNDTIAGVLIGGLLASVAPMVTLFVDSKRWRFDKKFEILRAERDRLEVIGEKLAMRLADAMANNSYPSDLTSDIMIHMPPAVWERFDQWMKLKPKSEIEAKHAYLEICVEIKRAIAELNSKIIKLVV